MTPTTETMIHLGYWGGYVLILVAAIWSAYWRGWEARGAAQGVRRPKHPTALLR